MPELKNGIIYLNSILYGNNQRNESSLDKLFYDFQKINLVDKKYLTNNKEKSKLEPLYPE